jgi:excisionase family DNA binding protein
MADEIPKMLTVSELATYLRVHRSTVYRLLKSGELPGFKVGSDWRFSLAAVDEWRLRQSAAVPAPKPADAVQGEERGSRAVSEKRSR